MNSKNDKHAIAVYVRYYLSPSETFVHRQLLGISSGFDPIVITSSVTNRELFPVEQVHACAKGFLGKVQNRLVQKLSGRYVWATKKQQNYWRQILTKNKVRLIHSHFGHFALDILPVARSLGIPLLVTFHGIDASQMLNDRSYTDALKPLFEYAHAITVSRNMLERLTKYGLDPERTDVHYIGVPVENFEFTERKPLRDKIANNEPLLFVQVSNFVEKKGHRYTIEAFAKYANSFPDHRLVLAGDGPLREGIQSMCRSLGIEDKVEFPGKVVREEVSDLMRSADVFLHHSVTSKDGDMEGLPTVLMEAMSTGLVTVTTRHSGIPELVEDGIDGYLVDERDVATYSQKLTDLLTTDYDMGRRARQKIEDKFNMSKQNLELQRIYAIIIDG
jgi:glycosyltransferase involved in cell wall biosynthesis